MERTCITTGCSGCWPATSRRAKRCARRSTTASASAPDDMNPTSRAILQTVVATDGSLTPGERDIVLRLISGEMTALASAASPADERLRVIQKRAAVLLSVNGVTIWRMTRDCLLHPVEILPGTWRYPFYEIARLAQRGVVAAASSPREGLGAKIASAA